MSSQLQPPDLLETPAPSFAGLNAESGMNTPKTPPNEDTLLAPEVAQDTEKTPVDSRRSRRLKWILVGIGAFVVFVVVLVLALYFTVIKPKHKTNHVESPSTGSNGNNTSQDEPDVQTETDAKTTGGDGSIIVAAEGNFTYKNPFGGFWVHDPKDPFNNNAKAQTWTPALNETWTWGKDIVRGVNLGGWLVLEPFISPALFEKYLTGPTPAVDEYSLSQLMRADGTIDDLEKHYQTFITEEDFAQIAGAGLNWVRLPVGFWAIETFEGEPYYAKVSWEYVLKAIQWARKYGLRINLDFHAHPGSQNGWNHSGFGRGVVAMNWLKGLMGIANPQRSLGYIRVFTEFITQDQYAPVVPMFGVVNEPMLTGMDRAALESFYYEAYKIIRGITGIGKGAVMSIHDGFAGVTTWAGFLAGADRLAMDVHPYFAFDGPNADPLAAFVPRPCARWGDMSNTTQQTFGIFTSGEFSAAINDCGLFVVGVPDSHTYPGDCSQWDNWQSWDQTTKDNMKEFILASMDALQNWFFWTWRIGESLETGTVRAPFWAYKLGLQNGWVPTDPREAVGQCLALGQPMNSPFNGVYQPWQTGADPAAQPTATAAFVWPPTTLGDISPASWLPTYTPTAPIIKLEVPKVTNAVDAGDGWYDDSDTTGMMAPVAGCVYPDAYNTVAQPAPVGPVCGDGAVPPPDPALVPVTTAATTTTAPLAVPTDPLAVPTATDPLAVIPPLR